MTRALNEAAVRRFARSRDLELVKARTREGYRFGGYMLTDARTNTVVAGGSPRPYFLTLAAAAAILAERPT